LESVLPAPTLALLLFFLAVLLQLGRRLRVPEFFLCVFFELGEDG
jgi:hypothetical protein